MIKLENFKTFGWESAIRGMRNPMNSWNKCDSAFINETEVNIGELDKKLMLTLSASGSDHRKFMRMITVYVDITAPLYWWKEFDTYKVGTVSNSCSTMHTITKKPFELYDFSCEKILNFSVSEKNDNIIFTDLRYSKDVTPFCFFYSQLEILNNCRKKYLETNDKRYWYTIIQMLPSSYNQRRTIMLNYEVLANIYHARKNHKLDEWQNLCSWIKEKLPYSEIITKEINNITDEGGNNDSSTNE